MQTYVPSVTVLTWANFGVGIDVDVAVGARVARAKALHEKFAARHLLRGHLQTR
jgi:hypothetical protein